jgi:Zn-dependent peptidase ImmA (M78 family)
VAQVATRVEQAAQRLLDAAGITKPPVPVDTLARTEGIRLAFDSIGGDDISGILYRRDEAAVMVVNAHHHPHRKRFTIAHEIGHYVLHKADAYLDGKAAVRFRDGASAMGTDREEREANGFAASLLMPAAWLDVRFRDLVTGSPSVDEDQAVVRLAEEFDVSQQALLFRLVNLGLVDPA